MPPPSPHATATPADWKAEAEALALAYCRLLAERDTLRQRLATQHAAAAPFVALAEQALHPLQEDTETVGYDEVPVPAARALVACFRDVPTPIGRPTSQTPPLPLSGLEMYGLVRTVLQLASEAAEGRVSGPAAKQAKWLSENAGRAMASAWHYSDLTTLALHRAESHLGRPGQALRARVEQQQERLQGLRSLALLLWDQGQLLPPEGSGTFEGLRPLMEAHHLLEARKEAPSIITDDTDAPTSATERENVARWWREAPDLSKGVRATIQASAPRMVEASVVIQALNAEVAPPDSEPRRRTNAVLALIARELARIAERAPHYQLSASGDLVQEDLLQCTSVAEALKGQRRFGDSEVTRHINTALTSVARALNLDLDAQAPS